MKVLRHVFVGLVFVSCVAVLLAVLGFNSPDGFRGLLCALVYPDDTVYAPGYSDSRFRRVTPGMTADELKELLGMPIAYWHDAADTDAGWRYSMSPRDTNYRRRVVQVTNGVVTRVTADFWFD